MRIQSPAPNSDCIPYADSANQHKNETHRVQNLTQMGYENYPWKFRTFRCSIWATQYPSEASGRCPRLAGGGGRPLTKSSRHWPYFRLRDLLPNKTELIQKTFDSFFIPSTSINRKLVNSRLNFRSYFYLIYFPFDVSLYLRDNLLLHFLFLVWVVSLWMKLFQASILLKHHW